MLGRYALPNSIPIRIYRFDSPPKVHSGTWKSRCSLCGDEGVMDLTWYFRTGLKSVLTANICCREGLWEVFHVDSHSALQRNIGTSCYKTSNSISFLPRSLHSIYIVVGREKPRERLWNSKTSTERFLEIVSFASKSVPLHLLCVK